ncbi:type I secretion system permease/ATPase [Microvirga mediterraneensis]|uniref:Type I secretion system permease/ATPase n=1 Tax=Microvirga mediterraneensis TaxID=2754695 RepID=A0A838BT49_9HYPH|nr:type I secretion system permease/ATPase [Microvirga mediterraneensis]MBA1157616.1 type I secretion system permease/ATPase [Microvirga mediterraneensis]
MKTSAEVQLRTALRTLKRPLIGISAISCLGNILMLTGPMFMMLVYNKVLSSKSLPTLAALTLLALLLYGFYGLLEGLRGKLMARVGITFDHRLAPTLFEATLKLPLHFGPHARNHDPLQDLAAIRNYLMGPGPVALLDLPWMPIYFAILLIVNPILFLAAAGGALFLVLLSLVNEWATKGTVKVATQAHAATMTLLLDARRNSEAAAAMSMGDDLCKRWGSGYVNSISHARDLADHASVFGAISKTVRHVLQSAMLALGAYLVIEAQMSPGAMIASSVILARALAPIDQVIGNWRSTSAAWQALRRLRTLTAKLPKAAQQQHGMPRPRHALSVRDIAIVPPGAAVATVSGVSFEIEAGDALGIIGPSGCGKSTLVRALVGAWPTARGEVRFDNALISQYSPDALADAIGHLPQSIELFDGTIAENIARFRKDATSEQVIEAARMAGVHDMILAFPMGYDTPVGEGGATLSGGQRQRIGLARALFGNPFLVVLDEPNSNLDPLGEQSLNDAIQHMRQAGKIVVIVAHRPSAIFAANKILSVRGGRAEMFGPKEQVLAALFPRIGQPHKPSPAPGVQSGAAQAAPAPIPQTEPDAPAAATVTNLDATRAQRANGHVS